MSSDFGVVCLPCVSFERVLLNFYSNGKTAPVAFLLISHNVETLTSGVCDHQPPKAYGAILFDTNGSHEIELGRTVELIGAYAFHTSSR